MRNPATLWIVPLAARVAACELCAASPEALRTSVVVRHARGASIQFDMCERCAKAMHRLIAVIDTPTPGGPAHVVFETAVSEPTPVVETLAADAVDEAVVIHEFAEAFRADDALLYTVRVYGQGRADGTWIGWLAFIGPDGATRETGRETTQSNREHLAYWASGLQSSYLEGSFSRAT